MRLFKLSRVVKHYAIICVVLVMLTFATYAFAGNISDDVWDENIAFEDAETKMEIQVGVLRSVHFQMLLLRHEWGHADDALRDAGINALSDVAQTDFLNIVVALWKIVGQTQNQKDKKRSVNSYMEEAISIFQTQLWLVYDLHGDYYLAWYDLDRAIQNHNQNHASPSEPDHSSPEYAEWEYPTDTPNFPCSNCDEESKSVIHPHQKKCGINDDTDVMGCGNIYYTCQPDQVEEHAPKYCGKNVWIVSAYRPSKELGVCGSGYRVCTTSKKDHTYVYEIVFREDGSYISGYRPLYIFQTKCGNGTTGVPSGAVHRPGTDIDNLIDSSLNCDDCLDNSDYCPNASAH